MTTIPDFRLEVYFSRWEFNARYHLTASDAETMAMSELLAMADADDRAAWDDLRLGYTETYGDPGLRAAIASTYSTVDADDVLCFAGAEEGLAIALRALLGRDDHAVVVSPTYQAAETIPMSLCDVTGVALDPDRDWRLDVDEVIAAIRPNTRVVAVNFPNNPTGAVMDRADFERLVAECDARGIRVFSDEVYRGVEADQERTLPHAADLSPLALSLNVVSKSLGLPGLRVGWIACRDRELLGRLERAKHYASICNAAPSEVLARIAVKARDQILARNRGIIATNVPVFDAFFAEFGDVFDWAPPVGGCVCFPRYLGGDGVEAFCRELVVDAGVLLLPASIYHSELTDVPADRFRVGVGRRDPEPGLAAFAGWLRSRRS